MYPILFELGPVTLYTFGVFVSAGFLLGMILLNRLSQKSQLNIAFILDYLFSLVLVTLAASRVIHVLLQWETFQLNPLRILFVWEGGFSFWGGVIALLVYFYYLSYRHLQPFLRWMDVVSSALLVMLAFGFLGFHFSFGSLTSRGFGIPTNLPWGTEVDIINAPYSGVALHPLSLYFVAGSIVTLVLLLLLRKFPLPSGLPFFLGLTFFSVIAVIVERLKWEPTYLVFGGVSFDLAISVLAVTAGLIGCILVTRSALRKNTA